MDLKSVCGIAATSILASAAGAQVSLEFLGRYETGVFDESASEIVAYDAATSRVFTTNAFSNAIDVVCISDPSMPTLEFSIDMSIYGGGVNSVAVSNGLVAVAVEADVKQDPGSVVFFDIDGSFQRQLTVGALPDMVTFTPDGRFCLTANEGEPDDDYLIDPAGSVSIIPVFPNMRFVPQRLVRTAGFERFDRRGVPDGVRVFGPNASPSQDLEPEYIAVSADSRTAYVSLQENNAFAVVDIRRARVTELLPLGTKDHSLAENAMDVSNRDGAINITTWPVKGLFQPDAIASYDVDGETYVVSVNEGDSRDYDGFSEEDRIKDLVLDPIAFPDAATLQLDENLGRLNTTTTLGDTDGDGDFDELFSYGARSVTIWNEDGEIVWDSASMMEQILAGLLPDDFNSTNDENGSFDARSDDKGPEPEAVAIAEIDGAVYAFCGLERIGGVMTFDITDPQAPFFVDYSTSRDFAGDAGLGTAGDLGPEGIAFISSAESPTGEALLVVSHEVSGTVAVYRIDGAASVEANVADIDGNGRINVLDLFRIIRSFGPCGSCACPEDLDGDGVVSVLDLLTFLRAWRG